MQTDRRRFIHGLIVSVGGAGVLAACGERAEVAPTDLAAKGGRYFTDHELRFLSSFCDALIPRTHTPGALDAQIPAFLDGLMADWAGAETKESYRETLMSLELAPDERAQSPFADLPREMAEAHLAQFDLDAFNGGEALHTETSVDPAWLSDRYRDLKVLIVNSYFASEPGAVEELDWRLAPGRWDPCAPLQDA